MSNENQTEPVDIAATLAADGWNLSYTCLDSGGRDRPSKWSCMLGRAPGRGVMQVTYTKGAAHRRWTTGTAASLPYHRIIKGMGGAGNRVDQLFGHLTILQAEAIDNASEPEPPTLDEVVWSVVTDAGSVRHGQDFAEFAGDFGLDSDSIKARETFDACRDEWSGLVRIGADFDALETLFMDY